NTLRNVKSEVFISSGRNERGPRANVRRLIADVWLRNYRRARRIAVELFGSRRDLPDLVLTPAEVVIVGAQYARVEFDAAKHAEHRDEAHCTPHLFQRQAHDARRMQ